MSAHVVYLLMTYNQREFVAEAVASALAQTFSPLEILISDDASCDGTYDVIVAEASRYDGPHTVRLNRNQNRQGSVAHLASAIEAIGENAFIITAHGDDIARPDRAEKLVAAWRRTGASMVSSGADWLTQGWKPEAGQSRFVPAEEIIAKGWIAEMLGATLAFESEVVTSFERLTADNLGWGLDHVLPLRAAAMKGIFYLSDSLISYRLHGNNMSQFFREKDVDPQLLAERHLAFELALRPIQKEDLLRLARKKLISFRHWRLVREIDRKIRDDLSKWSRLRASLKARGFAPGWTIAHEAPAQKISS
jgi:glycosyltransferase involved in cell wall biosynthesis